MMKGEVWSPMDVESSAGVFPGRIFSPRAAGRENYYPMVFLLPVLLYTYPLGRDQILQSPPTSSRTASAAIPQG